MLREWGGGQKASVKHVFKWVKCCSGKSASAGLHRMPDPPHSLISLEEACSSSCVSGGESRAGENDWNLICFYFLHKMLSLCSFSSHLSNVPLSLLPSFSSRPWPSPQIPIEWDKDGQWREVRGDGMQVSCHMTTRKKWRQRSVFVCAPLFLHT